MILILLIPANRKAATFQPLSEDWTGTGKFASDSLFVPPRVFQKQADRFFPASGFPDQDSVCMFIAFIDCCRSLDSRSRLHGVFFFCLDLLGNSIFRDSSSFGQG